MNVHVLQDYEGARYRWYIIFIPFVLRIYFDNLPVVDLFFFTCINFYSCTGSSYILILLLLHGFLSSLYLYLYYPFTLLLFHSLHSNLPKVVLHGPHVHTCGIHHKTQKSIAAVVSIFHYMLLAHT